MLALWWVVFVAWIATYFVLYRRISGLKIDPDQPLAYGEGLTFAQSIAFLRGSGTYGFSGVRLELAGCIRQLLAIQRSLTRMTRATAHRLSSRE